MTQNHEISSLEERIKVLEQKLSDIHKQKSDENHYRLLFDNVQHEVYVWKLRYDDSGKILNWYLADANKKALRTAGKSLEKVLGKHTSDIFDSGTSEYFKASVNNMFATHEPHSWEYYLAKTGQHMKVTNFPGDHYFISSCVDITATVKTETRLRDTVLQLEEAISAGNVGLWDWDLLSNTTYFSPEWKKQLGYAPHELANHFGEWESRVHPEDIKDVLVKVNETLCSGKDYHDIEFRMQHRNGDYRWILAHASMITNKYGKPIRLVGSHIDITERKQMEENNMQQEKLQALGTLASGIAHDFNNLLTPVLGYTQLIKTLLPEKHAATGYLEHIEVSAERAKDLSQQILLMTRKSIKNIKPVNIEKLAEEVISTVQSHCPESIVVQTMIEDELPTLGAEPAQIHRLLLNLCNNAVHAMPQGGELTVEISSCLKQLKALEDECEENYICIKIKDTGKGIDSQAISRIFEPFFTTKLYGTERGTGLGLAIVDSAVKQHKGHIEVASEVGIGTEFTIYLPIIAGHSQEQSKTWEKASNLQGLGIVLLDDELAICQLGDALLSKLGCSVVTFQHVNECIEFLAKHETEYDLLISDYALPEMSGDKVISTLREKGIVIPCVIATGFTQLATEKNCKLWQCARIISKPFTIDALRDAISRVVHASQATLE